MLAVRAESEEGGMTFQSARYLLAEQEAELTGYEKAIVIWLDHVTKQIEGIHGVYEKAMTVSIQHLMKEIDDLQAAVRDLQRQISKLQDELEGL